MSKPLFKTFVTEVRDIRNHLAMSITRQGKQIVLSGENKEKLSAVNKLLSEASNILEEIK